MSNNEDRLEHNETSNEESEKSEPQGLTTLSPLEQAMRARTRAKVKAAREERHKKLQHNREERARRKALKKKAVACILLTVVPLFLILPPAQAHTPAMNGDIIEFFASKAADDHIDVNDTGHSLWKARWQTTGTEIRTDLNAIVRGVEVRTNTSTLTIGYVALVFQNGWWISSENRSYVCAVTYNIETAECNGSTTFLQLADRVRIVWDRLIISFGTMLVRDHREVRHGTMILPSNCAELSIDYPVPAPWWNTVTLANGTQCWLLTAVVKSQTICITTNESVRVDLYRLKIAVNLSNGIVLSSLASFTTNCGNVSFTDGGIAGYTYRGIGYVTLFIPALVAIVTNEGPSLAGALVDIKYEDVWDVWVMPYNQSIPDYPVFPPDIITTETGPMSPTGNGTSVDAVTNATLTIGIGATVVAIVVVINTIKWKQRQMEVS